MSSLALFKKWIDENYSAIREEYFQFLRFKSISADPAFAEEMLNCAAWLSEYISAHTNMKSEILDTGGYPIVYAEDLSAGKDAPTILVYGHYDVQPVDPIELWRTDPFEPTERSGKIFSRGAVDDKGQIFYSVLSVRAWKEIGRELPVNLKFCIEGEEESSSMGLSRSLQRLKDRLMADAILVVDFDQFDQDTPAISLGARGLIAIEVTLTGSNADLHSGIHGGMAYNPNRAMVELLAKLFDPNGRVQVDGFYEDVLASGNKKFDFHFNRELYSSEFGVDAFGGEDGYSLAECNTMRPTLEINGIGGGYVGPAIKTVIPAHCTAKISCRLVPNQDPKKIERKLIDFLKKNVTPGMKIKFASFGGEAAFRGNPDSDLAKAVALASEEVTGKPCKNVLCGGSIPIIAKMVQELGCEVVGMGYGLPSDNIHAPNEHFDMKRLENGFLTVARTIELL